MFGIYPARNPRNTDGTSIVEFIFVCNNAEIFYRTSAVEYLLGIAYTTMFPEPVHYSRTDCPAGWKIRDWDTANKLLSYFEPERRPFAIFTLPDKSYVQCLGAKTRLTIEAREYHQDGSFTHWVFGRGSLVGRSERIEVSTGGVTVDASQLLSMRDARVIIRQFLEARTFPTVYHRHDVTERFTCDRSV